MTNLASQVLTKTHSGAAYGEWLEMGPREVAISINPATGQELGRVRLAGDADYETVLQEALLAFQHWRLLPAPARGDIVREIGEELRNEKDALGELVTLETGKIIAEGQGEVQEMIDIAQFATGLSRQLYGLSMHSERKGHRMYEQWHPLGVIGIISAFNFPVTVWSWNALIALVCGNTVVWKPSLKTPLTAVAVQQICDRVLSRHGWKASNGAWRRSRGGHAHAARRPNPSGQRDRIYQHGAARCASGGGQARPHTARIGRQQRRHRNG